MSGPARAPGFEAAGEGRPAPPGPLADDRGQRGPDTPLDVYRSRHYDELVPQGTPRGPSIVTDSVHVHRTTPSAPLQTDSTA